MEIPRFRLVPAGLSVLLALGLAGLMGCEDDTVTVTDKGEVILQFNVVNGGSPVLQDQLIYTNAAGNEYSVSKFEFLITDVHVHNRDTGEEVEAGHAFYGDPFAAIPAGKVLAPAVKIPVGDYDEIHLVWGRVWQGSRDDTETLGTEFGHMLWPPPNGGGYHAMRFEGAYTEIETDPGGNNFALHTGRLDRSGKVTDGQLDVVLDLNLDMGKDEMWVIEVDIDLNNWMNDPVYDFDEVVDSQTDLGDLPLRSPTMPNHTAQQMLKDNFADVFAVTNVVQIIDEED